MRTALAHGLKGNEPSMAINILGAEPTAKAYWAITGGYSKGDVAVFLDARTGEFSSQNAME
jgi:hypothetical protein